MSQDVKSAIAEFHQVVNMTPKELESWLKTEESQAVGQKRTMTSQPDINLDGESLSYCKKRG